jgi:hypothetical protein
MKTEIERKFRWGYLLSEQELRRLDANRAPQLQAAVRLLGAA